MFKNLLKKYGVVKTTAALSVICIVVSMLISGLFLYLTNQPNLRFGLYMAFLCPAVIAPIVMFSFCRLTKNLQDSQNMVMQVNAALQKSEGEKLKIYNAMIQSTHHILNNFLQQMMIFKLTAEDTPGFDPSILMLYGQIIEDATKQIEALSNISIIDEKSIYDSVTPQTILNQVPERVQQNPSIT